MAEPEETGKPAGPLTPDPPAPKPHARALRHAGKFLHSLGRMAWPGASIGAILAALVFQSYVASTVNSGIGKTGEVIVSIIALLLSIAALGGILALAGRVIEALPKRLIWAVGGVLATLWLIPDSVWLSFVGLVAAAGALVSIAVARGFRYGYSYGLLAAAMAILFFTGRWLAHPGWEKHLVSEPLSIPAPAEDFEAADPGKPGPMLYRHLTYGSGKDIRRAEYAAEADIITPTVDMVPYIPRLNSEWKRTHRKWYWGFDLAAFPLNAQVWLPEGNGPFPVAALVHGNEPMEDRSEAGFVYLGEHLASHGCLTIAIDANYLNDNWASRFHDGAMQGRARLILEHLKLLEGWNQSGEGPLAGKADLDRVILVGHSLGADAAILAAAYNRLHLDPENSIRLYDGEFGIRGVVAIAPSDKARLSGKPVPVEDMDLLVIQGAHDAWQSGFEATMVYERARLGDENFAASVYSYLANHGQFNSEWGRRDFGPPRSWLLNTAPLLARQEQETCAKALATAFAEISLKDNDVYRRFLRDTRLGNKWLPTDIRVSRYRDSQFRVLADYEEDADVQSASVPGASIRYDHLTGLREHLLYLRDGTPTENKVVYIKWGAGAERATGHYTIKLPPEAGSELDEDSVLSLDIGNAARTPLSLNLSLAAVDRDGNTALVPISEIYPIHPPLITRLSKIRRRERFGMLRDFEQVMQTVRVPLSRFVEANKDFNPERLSTIRLAFNQSPQGEIVLDNVGFYPGD